jgi:stage III sporulation protein AB
MMFLKVFGAIFVIAGCASVGFALCRNFRREEDALEQLVHALEWMRLELSYKMPALSTLCKDASKISKGVVGELLFQLATELEQQLTPHVGLCMDAAIAAVPQLPESVVSHLKRLGTSLGQFNLEGQLIALESAETVCRNELMVLHQSRNTKFRNYQVLGLCAGTAIVLLFL